MIDSIVIRKVGDGFGIFKFPKIDLICTVSDEESLHELLQDILDTKKIVEYPQKKTWPAVGRPYWFVNAPNPLEVSVNQGTITEDLLEELKDCEEGKYGNVFQTKEQAVKIARKLANLFE